MILRKHNDVPKGEKKYIACNTHLLFILFVFFFLLGCSIASFSEGAYALAIVFLIFCLLPVFCFLIAPMYVVFTAQEVTIVYLWRIKEHIAWREIRGITEYGSWFNKYSCLPEYHIAYPQKEKRLFFVNGSIPKTRKTKKLIKQFYKMKQMKKH